MCCGEGKVREPFLPKPPNLINDLWFHNTEEAKVFRKYCRSLNNAVCLASLVVGRKDKNKNVDSYMPTVFFQGKMTHYMYPLQAHETETPHFAQLYVLDSDQEFTTRFANMSLPTNITRRERDIMKKLLEKVQNIIHQHNPYVKDFKQILEMPERDFQQGKIIISAKAKPKGAHERVYNVERNLKELSIVTNETPHDLVIHPRTVIGERQRQYIQSTNPSAMPLHFTLLFINGTPGWHLKKKHAKGPGDITPREFFAYYLNVRDPSSDYLFRAGRLFQEWILDSWITCEDQRLKFIQFNQDKLRADSYKSIKDRVAQRKQRQDDAPDSLYHNEDENQIGRVVLPGSYIGSPRWFMSQFQDAMAIVRHYSKPTLFITMTTNPNWSEIKDNLLPDQIPQDRPDLTTRVFKQKKDQLIRDIYNGRIFGDVVAHLWVIEFQKRGLPHAHILIILDSKDIPKTAEEVDQIVCEELPPNPADPDISEEERARRKPLWDIVINNMIHGPCGDQNTNSPCMENGKCSKQFPKPFQKHTLMDEDRSYPVYRRRAPEDGGGQTIKNGKLIDNRWVVPYNPYLSLRYNCHINVESCISPKAAKYLYKYVTKGPDRAMVSAEVEGEDQYDNRDEVNDYENCRCYGSMEASYRLFAFPIANKKPPVQKLRIHLENEQDVFFVPGEEEQAMQTGRQTELTAFFKLNEYEKVTNGSDFDPSTMPRYYELPHDYTYHRDKKEWKKRMRDYRSIGRVHTVNPIAGDVFYLRILLHHDHCRGKTSFKDLKTIEGRLYDSYQEVCRVIGLLSDDQEWHIVLTETSSNMFGPQIRAVYCIILMFCQPADPLKLFDDFWKTWTEDFERDAVKKGLQLSENNLRTMVRLDLQVRLLSYEKDLPDFGLDPMTNEEKATVSGLINIEEPLIRDELNFDIEILKAEVEETVHKFTAIQQHIFQTIMTAVMQNKNLLMFISACGGCGKTFLLNALLKAVRILDNGSVATAMASTGIAAQLLHLGRTFHSRLKAPLHPHEKSTLNITAQSSLARLLQRARLLLVDEATLLHRFQLEALDRTLRDLMNQQNIPFGGKIIILAGDFRQCLPVIPGANWSDIVNACINHSPLWNKFQVQSLTENMRVRASGDPILEHFANWTLSLGDGTINDQQGRIIIPKENLFQINPNTKDNKENEVRSLVEFCEQIFPNMVENISDPRWLEGRAVLAPTNKEVDEINDLMESKMPGISTKLSSADALENYQDVMRFNIEYLNSLYPKGFPRHIISLKPGMPLMLLRNINPKEGLCNGTKLIYVRNINMKLLVCKLPGRDKDILIPRIKFLPDPGSFPFEWSRLQFPVRVAFSSTINKSQGQTLKQVGVWLRYPVFGHGQLYVASSRVGNPSALTIAIKQQPGQQVDQTDNVVYREVLL